MSTFEIKTWSPVKGSPSFAHQSEAMLWLNRNYGSYTMKTLDGKNVTPGYWWVERFESAQQPEVAYLTKNSGWHFMGVQNEKMVRAVGYSHPFAVISRCIMENAHNARPL